MASLAPTPASMQVSIEGSSPIWRSSSLQKPKTLEPLKRKSPKDTLRSTAPSIPSRYQTYFLANTEQMGFNSQAARFSTDIVINDNPGPGEYEPNKNSFETQSTSFSKKGTGGFASKSCRFRSARKHDLGPATYNPRPVENRIDFNKAGVSSNFKLPIAVKQAHTFETNTNEKSPAPNTYNLSGVHTGKVSTVTAEAAFKSKTKREVISSKAADNPAPCQYTIQDSVLHPSSSGHKSVFNSKSHRELGKVTKGPGPADYTPILNEMGDSKFSSPKNLPYYRQKHYLCISAPAMPLPPIPPAPGPGHYETQSPILEPSEKKLSSGAAFKSTTSRWISFGLDRVDEPGPGAYNPVTTGKQSYLYNVNNRWI